MIEDITMCVAGFFDFIHSLISFIVERIKEYFVVQDSPKIENNYCSRVVVVTPFTMQHKV
jgi:hypothetical protein